MNRRLYFVLPDEERAVEVVRDLEAEGVAHERIHAIPGKGVTLTQLPPATAQQHADALAHWERIAWYGNIALFGVATVVLVFALSYSRPGWASLAAAVMVASFLAGALFAMRVPDTHLDEFRDALAHEDVLLLVDVPQSRVAAIETLVEHRHPSATPGGVGWTLNVSGV
jgi:hypothetical protein